MSGALSRGWGLAYFQTRISRAVFCALSLTLMAGIAQAQSVGSPPNAAAITKPPAALPKAAQRPSRGSLAAPTGADACPFAGQNISTTLTEVTVENTTVLKPGEVTAAVADLLNHPADLSVVCKVRDRVAALFAAKGYRLTRVDLPPQTIEGGKLKLSATEGYVKDLKADGLAPLGKSAALARKFLEKPVGQRPTSWDQVERAVMLARDIPGAELAVNLGPTTGEPGAVELKAAATPRRWLDVTAGEQHLGSEELGRDALFTRFDLNGFTPYGDRSSLLLYETTTGGQKVGQVLEDIFLGSSGLSGDASLLYAKTHPGGALKTLDIDGDFLAGTWD